MLISCSRCSDGSM